MRSIPRVSDKIVSVKLIAALNKSVEFYICCSISVGRVRTSLMVKGQNAGNRSYAVGSNPTYNIYLLLVIASIL